MLTVGRLSVTIEQAQLPPLSKLVCSRGGPKGEGERGGKKGRRGEEGRRGGEEEGRRGSSRLPRPSMGLRGGETCRCGIALLASNAAEATQKGAEGCWGFWLTLKQFHIQTHTYTYIHTCIYMVVQLARWKHIIDITNHIERKGQH